MNVYLVYNGISGGEKYLQEICSSQEKAESFITRRLYPEMKPATEEPDKSAGIYLGFDGRLTYWARIDCWKVDRL